MSFFRNFKLPRFLKKAQSSAENIANIKVFDCNALQVKKRLGQGAFGDVYTTEFARTVGNVETVVVKKMLHVLDESEKKLFFKEAALLNGLLHPNIVKLLGVCHQPQAIMLEYVYFDFELFGVDDLRVSSLSDFLLHINDYNCKGFHDVINHAAVEMIQGLVYLHKKGIAHRDLKPANILVCNRHYNTLTDAQEIALQFQSRPIACKLTDFGESRSQLMQTQSVLASNTRNVDRGTVMYMAPEILVEDLRISRASISDLMLADLWALGMVLFSLIDPSLKSPYLLEVRSEGSIHSQDELKRFISSLLRRGKHPIQDDKYEVERATVWCALDEVYEGSVNFNPQSRLSLDKAATILSREEKDLDVIPLKISQATAVEQFDQKLATRLHEAGHKESVQTGSVLRNDGTNACAFLSVKIVDTILTEIGTEGDVFATVAGTTEDIIWLLPEKINASRDLSKSYDPVEAYDILLEKKIIKSLYDFSEELPFADGVFSVEGRTKLHSKLCELGRLSFAAIFTSDPFVLTIGCLDDKPYLIDTHPVTLRPGSGNSLIMVGKENSSEVWMSLCCWLWKRLYHGGVKADTGQSLAVVTPRAM